MQPRLGLPTKLKGPNWPITEAASYCLSLTHHVGEDRAVNLTTTKTTHYYYYQLLLYYYHSALPASILIIDQSGSTTASAVTLLIIDQSDCTIHMLQHYFWLVKMAPTHTPLIGTWVADYSFEIEPAKCHNRSGHFAIPSIYSETN